jgi:hypothetical protein
LVIVLATLVLCLSNLGLTKYAVIGILAGIIFWRWPLWIRYALGALVLTVLAAACSSNLDAQFVWAATYDAQITLNSNGNIWTVNERVTIPGAAIRQITEGNGHFRISLPPPGPDQYQLDITKFTQMMKPSGLTFVGVENGTDPIYSFPPRTLTHPIPIVPLVTAQTVHLPYLTLPSNVDIIPADDSKVYINAPRGVIEATTPTSQAGPTTTGEERVLDAGTFSDASAGSVSVSISTLSALARSEPLRSIARLSLAGGISWAIAGIWTLLVALAQAGAKAAAASGWKRIRRTKADADKADQKDHGDKPAQPQKPAPAAG